MKVIVTGILMASYLSISYAVKVLVNSLGSMAVEMLITMTLFIAIAFSQSSESFVWSLFVLLVAHQLVQLKIEVHIRIRAPKIQRPNQDKLSS